MIKKIFNFYCEGFRNMPKYGVRLWIIILIKVFVLFVILKIFFFQDHLKKYDTEEEKSEYVSKQLLNIKE